MRWLNSDTLRSSRAKLWENDMAKQLSRYRCPHCGKVVERPTGKQWFASLCDETGKMVRMQKVDDEAQ